MQNEWAGAQAFSSFDTYLAPFVKVDNLDYPEVKEMHRIFCIRRKYTEPLGYAGTILQHHTGLDGSG